MRGHTEGRTLRGYFVRAQETPLELHELTPYPRLCKAQQQDRLLVKRFPFEGGVGYSAETRQYRILCALTLEEIEAYLERSSQRHRKAKP